MIELWQDGIDKANATTSDCANTTNLAVYENDECSILFRWYEDESAKTLKYRSLNGPEKIVLFKKMYITTLIFLMLAKCRAYGKNFFHFISFSRKTICQILILMNMGHPLHCVQDFTAVYKHVMLHLMFMLLPTMSQDFLSCMGAFLSFTSKD